MSVLRSLLLLSVAALALAGCSGVREDLGLGRSPPDEFAVIDRPPLAMPPDFGLRPPTPGAPRPQEIDPSAHASQALFGTSTTARAPSESEKILLQQTGADKASPDIRTTINNESADVVDVTPHLVDQLLTWKSDAKPGTVVDADAEAQRIKDAQSKGEVLNKTATPVIEREQESWLGL